MKPLWIAVAGSLGALARYGVGVLFGPQLFPWATLAINVVGSFLLGTAITVAAGRHWSTDVTAAVTIGLVGSFTTFSTFTAETITLGRADRLVPAVAYVVASVVVGLLACRAGMALGDRITTA